MGLVRWRAVAGLVAFALALLACGARTGMDAATRGTEGVDAGEGAGEGGAPAGPRQVLLYGGAQDTDLTQPPTVLGDAWLWDGARWAELPDSDPGPRVCASAATLGTETILFGGADDDATWIWDGARWTARHVSGPSARGGAAMSTLGGVVVLFGGGEPSAPLGDTWTWDGAEWTRHDVPGPPPRTFAAAAALGDRVVLYGGMAAGGLESFDDTWTWDGEKWVQVFVAGPAKQDGNGYSTLACSMASLGRQVVMQCDLQTWTFDGTWWTLQPAALPITEPGPGGFLDYAAMSPTGSELVLFGGWDGWEDTGYTWTWSGTGDWTRFDVPGPPPRECAAIASR